MEDIRSIQPPGNSFSLFLTNTTGADQPIVLWGLGDPTADVPVQFETYTIVMDLKDYVNVPGTQFLDQTLINFASPQGNIGDIALTGSDPSVQLKTIFDSSGLGTATVTNSGQIFTVVLEQVAGGRDWQSVQMVANTPGLTTFSPFTYLLEPCERLGSTGVKIRTTNSNVRYSALRGSQASDVYRILAVNVQTETPGQALETMLYSAMDANGDMIDYNLVPAVDPYASQAVIARDRPPMMILDGRSSLQYTVQANASVRLDFMHVAIGPASYFEKAIQQRLKAEYNDLLLAVKNSRGKRMLLVPVEKN